MGKRGPAPTPTAILDARGSWRAKIREGEPTLPTAEPDRPAFLKGEALREWKRTLPLLAQMRVLTEADRATLAVYCKLWGEFVEFQGRCDKLLAKLDADADFPNYPQVFALRNSSVDRMMKEAAKLGFSPADRARLKAQAPETPDEGKGRFFKGRSA